MALGAKVWVGPGEYSWDPRTVVVLPNRTLELECRARPCLLAGAWLLAEASRGRLARANLSCEAEDAWGATVRVQGGRWRLEECDVRCGAGVAVDVTDGTLALPCLDGGLGPLEFMAAVADADAAGGGPPRAVAGDVTLERCGIGGEDPGRWERYSHMLQGVAKAVSAVDVSGGSRCRARLCTMEDTEVGGEGGRGGEMVVVVGEGLGHDSDMTRMTRMSDSDE